jgi:stearoyl-CoA desaturase (Delta-9 desaturase)
MLLLKQKLTQLNNLIKQNKYRLFLTSIYLVGIGSIVLTFINVSILWLLAALLWNKIIELIGHSIGMHRYFTHKSFETSPFKEKIIAWTSVLLGVGSPLAYVRNHRHHHEVTDTKRDVHSPHQHNVLSIILGLWEFSSIKYFMKQGGTTPRDWITNKTVKFIHNYYYIIWTSLTIITLIINWKITLYLLYLPAFLYHLQLGIFINWIGHTYGYRNFETNDKSRNNNWIHWWLLGEGLHNNHHAEPWRYNWTIKDKDAFDVSGWIIDKCFLK